MHSAFVGEHLPGNAFWHGGTVAYLDASAREKYRLSIRGGKIFDANGTPFDTSDGRRFHSNVPSAIFVMDEHGGIFASKIPEVGRFHHSSILAGAPVAAAGEIQVRNGNLIAVSDRSGHYLPAQEFTRQFIDELEERGVDTSKISQRLEGKQG